MEPPHVPEDPLQGLQAQPEAPLERAKFDWKWVFVGVVVMVGGHVALYLLLYPLFRGLLQRPDQVLTAAALMMGLGFVIYFIGGLLVGRMSHSTTVSEPAVAGVIGMVVVFVLQLFLGMVNVVGLVIGAPFCFGLAYFGGACGERWQRWAQSR